MKEHLQDLKDTQERSDAAQRAARNIAKRIGRPPSGKALVVTSQGKAEFAREIVLALKEGGVAAYLLELPGNTGQAEWGLWPG